MPDQEDGDRSNQVLSFCYNPEDYSDTDLTLSEIESAMSSGYQFLGMTGTSVGDQVRVTVLLLRPAQASG